MRPISFILVMLLVLSACAGEAPLPTLVPLPDEPTAAPTETPLPTPSPLPSVQELTRATDPSQQSYVRVIHAAPDVPTLDVYIERLAVATSMDFTSTTEPTAIVAGDYFLRVVPRGLRPDGGEFLLETPLALAPGERVMLILTGTTDSLVMRRYAESIEPLDQNQSRVRVINMQPAALTAQIGTDTLNIQPGELSTSITLPPDDINITFPDQSYDLALRARNDYTLIVSGTAVISIRTTVPGRAQLRVVNATESAIDVYLNDQILASQLTYTRASERRAVPASNYVFTVFAAGASRETDEPLYQEPVIVNADDTIALIVAGREQTMRIIRYRENLSPTAPDAARVAFVNPLETVSRVRVDTQTGPLTGISDLLYGQEPQVAELPLLNYTFFWTEVENGETATQIESASDVQFEAGITYLYLLSGRGVDQPAIISERVGIIDQPATVDDPLIAPDDNDTATVLRFINALTDNNPVDLWLDESVLIRDVPYTQGSSPVPVRSGPFVVQVVLAGTTETLVTMSVELEAGVSYSIVAYGTMADNVQIAMVTDNLPQAAAPQLRLLNSSLTVDSSFGLGYSRVAEAGNNRTSQPPSLDNVRGSIPFGVEKLFPIADISSGVFSPVSILPAGIYSLHILDNRDDPDSLAATIAGIALEENTLYDVIAAQEPETRRVTAFVLAYPLD